MNNYPILDYAKGKALVLNCRPQKDIIKTVSGRKWEPMLFGWSVPFSSVPDLIGKLPELTQTQKFTKKYNAHVALMEKIAQMKESGEAEPLCTFPVDATMYKHQIVGANIGITLDNSAMLLEQGCGKTLCAIAVIGKRFQDHQISRCLVVCPSCVAPVWHEELEKFATFDYVDEFVGNGATGRKRLEALIDLVPEGRKLKVAVCNYESVWRNGIEDFKPDMIICDESQRIKNHTAKQSKAMHLLGRKAKYRMILTGTPITQNPLDFYSQYLFLDNTIFGNNYYSFRNNYAVMGGYNDKQIVKYVNLGDLVRKAHSVAWRVTKEQALDLPEQIDQMRYCELEPSARKEYDRLARDGLAMLKGVGIVKPLNVLSQLLRLSQFAGGFMSSSQGTEYKVSNAKMSLLEETLNDLIDADKKCVIFARFVPEILAISELCTKLDMQPALIYGATRQCHRSGEMSRFQTDDSCRAFVGQLQACGLGITLHAADTAIFYSYDYSFANYEQARARIHRIGQRNNCTYIHLVTQNTVDQKILGALSKKRNVADDIVDNWKSYFGDGE